MSSSPDEASASSADATPTVYPMRLQRFLARAGVASRRGSENLMTVGRVTVNGVVATELGTKVDPLVDQVAVDGLPVAWGEPPVYLMLNKPAGYLTTMDDPQGRACVATLVPVERYPGLFPVGRLDHDTTGLLLFSTDGDFGNGLLHPRYKVEKTYEATVEGEFTEAEADVLRSGIELTDGMTLPARISIGVCGRPFRARTVQTAVTCIIHEGRKRQVKRMFSALGHPVITLHRSAFGPLVLGELPEGSWRMLTDTEVQALQAASGMDR
jgi:23S rRNA pseudouridine2605 synthase